MTVSRQALHQLRHRDRHDARTAIQRLVGRGRILPARAFACVTCAAPADEYDHHRGYEYEHRYDVEPVCRTCHVARGRRPRSVNVPAGLRDSTVDGYRREAVHRRAYMKDAIRAIVAKYGERRKVAA